MTHVPKAGPMRRLLAAGLVTPIQFGAAQAAHAQPSGPPISSVWARLDTTVYVPELGETVHLGGGLHIVSGPSLTDGSVDLHANLADADAVAVGGDSGTTYRATGTDTATLEVPPEPPSRRLGTLLPAHP